MTTLEEHKGALLIQLEQAEKSRDNARIALRQFVTQVAQLTGAIWAINNLIEESKQTEANGGGIVNDVEATDSPKRQLSS